MSTQDPKKDIRRILDQFFLSSKERPKFKVIEERIKQNHTEINMRMIGTNNFPCPDIDHLIKAIGDGEPNRKFIDWLWRRRGIPALTETINDRVASGQPSFLREMLNIGERVDGGNDDDQIAALTGRNTALNAQHAEATGMLQEERRTSAQHLLEIASLRRELASLKTDTEAAKVAAAFVSDAKVAGLEADKRSLQERISRLEERISGLEKEKADLVKKAEKTDAQLKEQQENLDGLESLIEELTLEKNAAKDAARVNGDENAAQDNDEQNGDEEESDDNEDEEESDDKEEGGASDGNEDRDGKQDTLSLLGNAIQKFGNVAVSAASGVVGLVTTGVTRVAAHASDAVLNANGSLHLIKKKSLKKKNSGKTPTKVTRQPGGSGGIAHKRTREDEGTGPSDGKKHCPA
jgi:hypothetical protein